MISDKKRKDALLVMANDVISNTQDVCKNGVIESESFNGQIAAFPVAVAMSGLKTAMALYYSDTAKSKINKKVIISLLAKRYSKDKGVNISRDDFFKKVIETEAREEPALRKNIIEYSIALKLAIRTFKFKES